MHCWHWSISDIYTMVDVIFWHLAVKRNQRTFFRNEQEHDKTNKMTCSPNEDSCQPGHPPSLISLRCPSDGSLGPHLPIKRISKTLIRLGGCTGWTGYSLEHMSFFSRAPVQKSSNALPCMQYAYALPFSMRQKMLRASKYRNTNSLIISTQNPGFTPEQCIIEPQHDKTCLREFPTRPVCAATEAS